MCYLRNVTRLSTSLFTERVGGEGNAAADTLYECLRAWSLTLEYLKIDIPEYRYEGQPFSEAIASLRELRELQIMRLQLDFAPISRLPRLERFATVEEDKCEEVGRLLEDSENFPSLSYIAVEIYNWDGKEVRMQDVCARRNIELHEWR